MRNLNERLNRLDLSVRDFADLMEEAKIFCNTYDYPRAECTIMNRFSDFCINTSRDYDFYKKILYFFSNRSTNDWDYGNEGVKLITALYNYADRISSYERVEVLEADINLLYRDLKISANERDNIVDTYKESYLKFYEEVLSKLETNQ